MSRYLPSFQKNKTKFLHELNSKNDGPVLLLKTIFRVVYGNQSESTFSKSGMAVFFYFFIFFLFLITFIQSTINNQKYLQTLRYLHYLQYNI